MKIKLLLLLVGLSFSKAIIADSTFVQYHDEWKYFDGGYIPSSAWKSNGYSDTAWASGYGKLGYGDGNENTVVSYGPDASNKYITTYFRKTINIPDPSAYASYHLNLLRDDGAIVYINGNEVFRSNMPASAVSYSTLAFTDAVDDGAVPQTIVLLPTSFQSGVNVIAVEVHQYDPASSDLCFDMEMVGYDYYVPQLIRQPYLQMVSSDAISVRWRTNVPCFSEVKYGTHPDSLNLHIVDSVLVTDHEIRITGLQPEQKYFYAVTDLTTLLQGDSSNYFSTAPVAGQNKHSRIWIMADTGVNTVDQNTVRDAFLNYNANAPIDMLWMLGDNAYMAGTDQEYQDAFFQNHYEDILKNIPLFTIAGNHENYTANAITQTGPYYDIFSLPANGECGGLPSGSEAYYSFDYGKIHVIALEANTPSLLLPGSTMLTWLQNDLAATTQKWKVVMIHNPPYTKGGHDSDTENDLIKIRQNIMPILEQYKTDLVLSGHSHVYERTYFLDGHYGFSSTLNSSMIVDSAYGALPFPYKKQTAKNYKGIVMVQAGCSGVVEGVQSSWPHPAMRSYLNANLGSLLLDVNADTLTVKFVDNTVMNPHVLDEFSIVKQCDVTPVISSPLTKLCVSHSPISLQGTPAGGFFNGAGVTDSTFNPSSAGGGLHTVSYTYHDTQGCNVSDSVAIKVVDSVPAMPTIQSGNQFVCPPSSGESVWINSVTDADGYHWSGVASINFKSPVNDTLVKFELTSILPSYKIWVSANNICGSSAADTIVLTSQKNVPLYVTGSLITCGGDSSAYFVNSFTSLASSWWSATAGIKINGSVTPVSVLNQLSVMAEFDSVFTDGIICVANKESCLRNMKASCIAVSSKPAIPSVILGPGAAIGGNSGLVYYVNPVAGATGYLWEVPSNAIIVAGQNTPSITVNFLNGFSGGIISVKSLSNCDESEASLKLIRSYSLPFSTTTLSPAKTSETQAGELPSMFVYPNPVKDKLQITLQDIKNTQSVQIWVKDISGKVIFTEAFPEINEQGVVQTDVSKLSGGYYFLIVKTNDQLVRAGFIKD
jgi:hypothetical protein